LKNQLYVQNIKEIKLFVKSLKEIMVRIIAIVLNYQVDIHPVEN